METLQFTPTFWAVCANVLVMIRYLVKIEGRLTALETALKYLSPPEKA